MKSSTLISLLLLLVSPLSLSSTLAAHHWQKVQPAITISGLASVVGQQPGRGVRIAIKGTNTTTYTDSKGHYVLKQVSPKAVLVYSYVNAQTKEVSVNGSKSIVIVLPRKANNV